MSTQGESVCTAGGSPVAALAFGTSGIAPELTQCCVFSALRAGYRHIDCAPLYGNEVEVGKAIAHALSQGLLRRDELFVTTKLLCTHQEPEDVLPCLQQSLRDLQLEYVDLFLIHWPLKFRKGTGFPPKEEDFLPLDIKSTWRAMESTVEAGLTRAIGVSNFSTKKLESLLEYAVVKPAFDQVEMHPGWQQQTLRAFCKPRGILVSAFAALGAPGTFYGRNDILSLPLVLELASKHKKTPAQIAIRWSLQQGVCTIVKSSNAARIEENNDVWDWKLSEEDLKRFSDIPQSRMPVKLWCNLTTSPYRSAQDLWDGEC
ncbi:hypothetical protein M758_3G016400 [Ceratodon purpureus]|nr:hypothetical protein M758_3G016400 [Ceratodon purpureus]